ncbi:uncharacterized protein LOC135949005 [Calliphora vicina]|uniref:uncharacterized protein LOC135949005 n=1 Tax=Calliphora vicina TaxID=7373 RepID=UPI00325A533A
MPEQIRQQLENNSINIMEMKSKVRTPTATSTFYCYFCSRHILITFVGMTLLIVNYGVNTVQMSAVPHRNGNCNSSICSSGNNVVSSINGNNLDNKNNSSGKAVWKRKSIQNITNLNSNRNTNFLHIALPAMPTVYKDNKHVAADDSNDNYADNSYYSMYILRHDLNNNTINHTETDLVAGQFGNFRKSRIFGLLGSNFSLSYNLSLNTGTSAGNITVVAPAAAPAYYYAPAPYYPYGYYNPYAYNPYAYNPYAYDPYAGYGYYG